MDNMKPSSRFTLAFLSVPAIVAAQATTTPGAIDTLPPKTVIESPFTFQSGTLMLPGTLTLPANYSHQIPVALIVAGSGPTDRNGNSGGPLRAQNNSNLYAILAWQLADAGIASVRYDKRSIGENIKKLDLPNTSIDDFV
ncbi:MAG: hypothetical protein M3P00_13105, partial [Gemmatimonadota bacterium]|nr:hypothetical protein [Gemmatimonadota bacterium]